MTPQAIKALLAQRPDVHSRICPHAFARWNSGLLAAATETDPRVFRIHDVIGHDWTGAGITAGRLAAELDRMGPGPVTIEINSPGGDVFEGFAMYAQLREHPGQITAKIMGLAASAASIVAMAADHIQMARPAFFMIHNTWSIAAGNRLDFAALAAQLESIDIAMADLYAHRTGIAEDAIRAMLDAETWIGAKDAIETGFAEALLDSDEIEPPSALQAHAGIRQVEQALRAQGLSKRAAMSIISQIKTGAGDPAGNGSRDAPEPGVGNPTLLHDTAALAASLEHILR